MRPITIEELPGLSRFVDSVFLQDPHDDDAEISAAVYEPERSIVAFDGAEPVASALAYTREMTVPGGPMPIAGVSWVAVAPTHRRRGLLTRMMGHQLSELHDHEREPVAVLWASEGGIYGRFGYGLAARNTKMAVDRPAARLRPDVDRGDGRVRLLPRDEALPLLTAVYDRVRVGQVGHLDRRGRWWDHRLYDPERWRKGASTLRYAVHEDIGGRPDAYAIYNTKPTWRDSGPCGEVAVREVQASTATGYAAVWGFLIELDLIAVVTSDRAAADEPLNYLVTDPGSVRQALYDALWVRLVDVDRALAARRYAVPIDVVLDVSDDFCPWNAGRYRLTGDADAASCTRTKDAADLALTTTALGAIYLGGTTLATLAAAGLVTEHRPGTVAGTSTAFAALRQPWCPEVF